VIEASPVLPSSALRLPTGGKYSVLEQNDPVFAWTYDLFQESQQRMTLDEAQALVQHVWFFYRPGTIAPLVKAKADGQAQAGRYIVELPRWAQTKYVVLHEVAHSISMDDDGYFVDKGYAEHGPLYVTLVMDLYSMFMGVGRQHMLERAAHFGVVVA
jgi:hypothetical protein